MEFIEVIIYIYFIYVALHFKDKTNLLELKIRNIENKQSEYQTCLFCEKLDKFEYYTNISEYYD